MSDPLPTDKQLDKFEHGPINAAAYKNCICIEADNGTDDYAEVVLDRQEAQALAAWIQRWLEAS